MFILKQNQEVFQINCEVNNITPSSIVWINKMVEIKDRNSIYLTKVKQSSANWSNHKNFISNSGQYSLPNFEIESFKSTENYLFYKIKHKNIILTLIDSADNLNLVIDKIGETHILITDLSSIKPEQILTLSQNTNAKIVVLLCDKSRKPELDGIFINNLTNIENGYKIKSKDLTNDITQYLILSK